MRKGVAASSIVLSTALALSLSGCMTKQGDVGNKNIRSNSYRAQSLNGTRFANDGANEANRIHGTQRMNNNVTGTHGISNMEISQSIADKLAALPEIDSAYVMLTNNNAYVAIVEDKTRTGTGTSRIGTNSIHRATPHSMSVVPNRNTARSGYRGLSEGDGRMFGTDGRTVDGTSGFSDAGNVGTNAVDISDALKNKVADLVKGMNPSVNNVYVTANADFYGRMKGFADDARSGHPIQGMVTQFNALVDRIFPERSGTGTGTDNLPSRIAPTAPTPAARYGTPLR